MAQALDSALKERVRTVFDGRPLTEAELRKLFEEGHACVLILNGQLEQAERLLAELTADPSSSIGELAQTVRRIGELRPELDALRALMAELDQRARELRASWTGADRGVPHLA
jgi:hypothetical protein